MRRLLVALAVAPLALSALGCSPVGRIFRGDAGGSSSGHEDGGQGGSGSFLFAISGFEPGVLAGSSGGRGGAPATSGEGSDDPGLADRSDSPVSGATTDSASASTDGATTDSARTSADGATTDSARTSTDGATTDSASASADSATTAAYGLGRPCDPSEPIDTSSAVPELLSATGLYWNIATKTLAADVLPFTPLFPLWSDGAEKHRWVHLPGCAKIDTSDMDRWEVPVGTKIWKEFAYGGVRVETRYLHRWGPGASDYVFQAYQWNDDGSDATPVSNGGVKDARGTTHDIPGAWECEVCHGHAPERVLGLSAIQLSHGGPGLTMASLSAAGRLTVPGGGFRVPGDATARAALGYLHGNCAHCHNTSPSAVWFTTPFSLKIPVAARSVAETDAFLTAVGVAPEKFVHPGVTHRIKAGDPASSAVAYRMGVRGSEDEMPALGSEVVDPDGLARITAWIRGLSP